MILRSDDDDEIEIRKGDAPVSYKFGGDHMAEYMYHLSLEHDQDECAGSTMDYGMWFARFGKRILFADDFGAVWHTKFPSESDAQCHFGELESKWIDSLNDVVCLKCETEFESTEGVCWNCGSKQFEERTSWD